MKGAEADAEYDAHTGTTFVDSKGRPGSSQTRTRKRAIIIGVVAILIAVIVVVVVVVVVVTQKKKDDGDNSNHSKYSKECGPFKLPDKLNFSDLSPTIISNSYTCPLGGDCWSGEKCFECFKLDTWKVGNINYIPVCCPDCLVRGLSVSNSGCNCRYNGR
ncbi:uncharacterized protein LOC132717321 [Ruditapes philippinarum]|uniref:uncharacterized protein LOC132717321 n=1 Tax=Ruditapes philippinarum TaxID=129788 RepID=UPI00295C2CC0|nr:uncharacterized protein LOC132717321 [Ruditapes philippinarum]XP_060556743.1 uncharacterized protein LOC132717321 [Ruditapes philippinarum]